MTLGFAVRRPQARVTLNGKFRDCSRWGTAEAHARYAELVREWQERGERPADLAPNPEQATVLLGDLPQQFLHHVDGTGRYWKNGEPTAQRAEFVNVINSLTGFLPLRAPATSRTSDSARPRGSKQGLESTAFMS